MGVEMAGRREWDIPSRRALAALGRIHRGDRPPARWIRLLVRVFGAS